MSHEVETMFYTRTTPWHGLGQRVDDAQCSADALKISGLDWNVSQQLIKTEANQMISGYVANIRSSDQKVLGIVSDRYKVIQNAEAFAFTDSLFSEGIVYETAGSLKEGKCIWLLAKLPNKYQIADDEIDSYLVFTNAHDGSSGVKIAMTPIRVVCQNTLNMALNSAKRIWSTNHVGNISDRLNDAKNTLLLADKYMYQLKLEGDILCKIPVPDKKVLAYLEHLIPYPEKASDLQIRNTKILREGFLQRYNEAPDLRCLPKNGWRFINAVSDFATHTEPLRKTKSFRENLFIKTIDGNPIIDKAYEIMRTLAK